jgi:hypothetical protein
MSDLTYLQHKPFTVVLVYDDGSAQGDIRLLPGVAEWSEARVLIHPAGEVDDFIIPASVLDDIKPATPELRHLLGEAEYYVVLHIAPLPDDEKTITARFVALE